MRCLDGTVVLDLARRYPGAYVSMFLGDFGAEVIKVDPPGPSLLNNLAPRSTEERIAAYSAIDRNKRSIVLDFKKEGALETFSRLVKRADVLIEGFRPGVMDRLGLGYRQLSEINPRLIYCSVTGFGQDGPYAAMPAHDMNYIAIGGALSLIGERNGQPYLPSNLVADMGGAGMHATVGVLLGLLARQKTGKGQYIDVSMLDSVLSLLAYIIPDYFESGVVPKRGETRSTGAVPQTQVFRCKDGKYFTIAAAEKQFWVNLCRALGREDLIPEHDTIGRRAERAIGELAAIFKTQTRDEWFAYLAEKQTCSAPVYDVSETLRDPQVLHRKMVVEVDHPTFGKVKHLGVPIKLSDTPGSIRRLGVPTGSDANIILEELGYTTSEIAALGEQGALG